MRDCALGGLQQQGRGNGDPGLDAGGFRGGRRGGEGGLRGEGGRRGGGLLSEGAGLTAYVPGSLPTIHPRGVATFVPKGSKIVFQIHYTPNGTAQDDQSSIGVVFADPSSVKKRIHGGLAINRRFAIPPGDDNYEVTAETRIRKDQLLLSMSPHMHLRGKSFRFEAHYPNGAHEVLLDVPRYDFNWQLRYELAEPKKLPAGTRIACTAHFDNSKENLANPDPAKTVEWGPQTWEEMMIGFYTTVSVDDDAHLAHGSIEAAGER